MDREEIKKYLPHREPMLLVDSSTIEGDTVHSQYTIRENEFFVQGHFPGNPVVPGVILCEIMAQSSVLLLQDEMLHKMAFYAGIDAVRFKQVVRPGDTVEVEAHITGRRGVLITIAAKASVAGKTCCSGNLSFFLTDRT